MPKDSDFALAEEAVPEPGPGQALVRVLYLSLDPYMRGRMSAGKSYAAPVGIGEVMTGGAVGEVVRSEASGLKEGDLVEGMFGWQEYALCTRGTARVLPDSPYPPSYALGILGMPGATAYFGLLEVGRPRPGDTVVVSAASGAVGAVVGQIAKIGGCRVVGTVGSDEKAAYITDELGFDAAINYRTANDLGAALDEACPGGIDVYFDNVGGPMTDAVMQRLAFQGADRRLRLYPPLQPDRALPGAEPPAPHPRQPGAGRGLLGVRLAGPLPGGDRAADRVARRRLHDLQGARDRGAGERARRARDAVRGSPTSASSWVKVAER